ncbi:MAG: hypothetical protein MJ155_02670, partial [Candidatus Saccharibacteria bacterium]|nr:hypothetical protein [Candidatus Saccharibacteria bacterium]
KRITTHAFAKISFENADIDGVEVFEDFETKTLSATRELFKYDVSNFRAKLSDEIKLRDILTFVLSVTSDIYLDNGEWMRVTFSTDARDPYGACITSDPNRDGVIIIRTDFAPKTLEDVLYHVKAVSSAHEG